MGCVSYSERYFPGGAMDKRAFREASVAPDGPPRDVFVYFISGAKERAPAAAKALLQRLGAG